jgi:hypothetical protein
VTCEDDNGMRRDAEIWMRMDGKYELRMDEME